MRKTITTTTITSLGFNPNSTKYIKKKNAMANHERRRIKMIK